MGFWADAWTRHLICFMSNGSNWVANRRSIRYPRWPRCADSHSSSSEPSAGSIQLYGPRVIASEVVLSVLPNGARELTLRPDQNRRQAPACSLKATRYGSSLRSGEMPLFERAFVSGIPDGCSGCGGFGLRQRTAILGGLGFQQTCARAVPDAPEFRGAEVVRFDTNQQRTVLF